MKIWITPAILLFSVLASAQSTCNFKNVPKILFEDDHEVHELWELNDEPYLWSNTPPDSEAFNRFLWWVWNELDATQDHLIRIQRDYFASFPMMVKRFDLFLDGKIENIFNTRCFEAFLLARHTSRFPLEKRPSEYMAFVLRNKKMPDKLRVYFSYGDKNSDFSPPTSKIVFEKIQNDLLEGWGFDFHLHSHPFLHRIFVDFVGGTIVPSDDDILSYQYWAENYGMKEALLTNGITTAKILKNQLNLLLDTVPGLPQSDLPTARSFQIRSSNRSTCRQQPLK